MTIESCKPNVFFRRNQHLAGEGIPRVVSSSGPVGNAACFVFSWFPQITPFHHASEQWRVRDTIQISLSKRAWRSSGVEGQSPASKSWPYLGIPLRRSMHSQLCLLVQGKFTNWERDNCGLPGKQHCMPGSLSLQRNKVHLIISVFRPDSRSKCVSFCKFNKNI